MTASTIIERPLRVAWVWNGTLQGEEIIGEPRKINLGLGDHTLFPLPEGLTDEREVTVLEPTGSGYSLRIAPGMGGRIWTEGNPRDIARLTSGSALTVNPNDFGIVTLGSIAVFFQHVKSVERPPLRFFSWDANVVASLGLSFFLFFVLLLLCFLDLRERPQADPFELPAALIAKFMVTPPPEDILQEPEKTSGTNTEDPGMRDREESGGKAHEGDEGRVGHENAKQEQTVIEGQRNGPISAKVRSMGLLGALSGGSEGNAIAAALDVPHISDLLSGMGAASTVVGVGSRGAGLRGSGRGGGGDGPGGLFGAGSIGTGAGAGSGSGLGKGAGGIGVKGRERREAKIAVQRGQPSVSGYLSAEQINRVVRANEAAIRYCYEVEVQRQPDLRGRVEIAWQINLQGAVTTARVSQSTLRNARVEGCLVRQIRRWRFPQPDGGEVRVNYPFIFGLQGG